MQRRFSLVLAALVAAAAVGATMYKWVDEHGVTHYSDAPPAKQKEKAQRLENQTAPALPATEATAQPSTKSWREKNEQFEQRHRARQQQLDEELKERQRAAEMTDIQRGARTPVPGGTGAPPTLQRDVLRLLVMMDSAKDPECTNHRIIGTEWVDTNRETRTAVERWTLDRCGKSVRYRVTFMPAPQGGTNFSVQAE